MPGDAVWTELDDRQQDHADLLAVTQDMPISCRDNAFTTFIDHIVGRLGWRRWWTGRRSGT